MRFGVGSILSYLEILLYFKESDPDVQLVDPIHHFCLPLNGSFHPHAGWITNQTVTPGALPCEDVCVWPRIIFE